MTLSCVANGLSLLNVTWYKSGEVMSHHLGNRTSKAVLTLYNITREDWGEYVCVANNSVGEDRKSVSVRSKLFYLIDRCRMVHFVLIINHDIYLEMDKSGKTN